MTVDASLLMVLVGVYIILVVYIIVYILFSALVNHDAFRTYAMISSQGCSYAHTF